MKINCEKIKSVSKTLTGAVFAIVAHLFHPRSIEFSYDQALYVQSLFMGGSNPAEIGRAVDKTYNRQTWRYLQAFDQEKHRFVWSGVDYEIDGLEYLRAAMIKLGAIVAKSDGDYYQTDHPMVQRIASIAANAPVPGRKGE